MDIRRALTFAQDDEERVTKILIAVVLVFFSVLVIPAFLLYGYMIRVIRGVMAGSDTPMPAWDDWGGLLKDGFFYAVAGLVYTLPIWLLVCCSSVFFIATSGTGQELSETLAGLSVLIVLPLTCVVMLFAIAYTFLTPAIAIQLARHGNIGACLRFGEVWGILRDNAADIIIAVLVQFGLSTVLSFLLIVPVIGWIVYFVAAAYVSYFVMGHLYGQIGAGASRLLKEKAVAA